MYTTQQVLDGFRPYIVEFVGRLLAPPPGHRWTSWYRDAATNKRVGGHPASQHRIATGIDVAPVPPLWWQDAIRARGLIVIAESDHAHIQLWPAGALERAGVRFDLLP